MSNLKDERVHFSNAGLNVKELITSIIAFPVLVNTIIKPAHDETNNEINNETSV